MAFSEEEMLGQFADTVGQECAETMKKLVIEFSVRNDKTAAEGVTLLMATMDRMIVHVLRGSVPEASYQQALEIVATNAAVNLGLTEQPDAEVH